MTRKEAAKKLGVSRQAFQAYISEKEDGPVPRREHYRRIFEVWPDFKVVADDGQVILDKGSHADAKQDGPRLVEQQLSLVFEALRALRQEDLAIDVERTEADGRVLVHIQVKIPA